MHRFTSVPTGLQNHSILSRQASLLFSESLVVNGTVNWILDLGAHRYLYHIKVHGVTVMEEEKRVAWFSHVVVKRVQFDCSSFAFT